MRKVRDHPAKGGDAAAGQNRTGRLVTDPAARRLSRPSPPCTASSHRSSACEIRDAREWLGMSVDELADRTRIRPYVIESIEVGDFSPCGGDFYARGHLRMLAGVLGIDPAPILSSYDAHLARPR